MDKEKLFNQYKNMINKFAWHNTKLIMNGKNVFEDFQAQGYLIFCQALESFDEKKASFCTHLYNSLRNGLSKYRKKYYMNPVLFYDDMIEFASKDYDQAKLFFIGALKEITENGREIIEFVLTANEKLGWHKLHHYFVSTGKFKNYQFKIIMDLLKKWWRENKEIMDFPGVCCNLQDILMELRGNVEYEY
jgi:hypothetical protein